MARGLTWPSALLLRAVSSLLFVLETLYAVWADLHVGWLWHLSMNGLKVMEVAFYAAACVAATVWNRSLTVQLLAYTTGVVEVVWIGSYFASVNRPFGGVGRVLTAVTLFVASAGSPASRDARG